MKGMANHITDVETMIQEQYGYIQRLEHVIREDIADVRQKLEFVIALLRGRKEEEGESEPVFPRPATSTT